MQIAQQQSDTKIAHELSATRFTELSDSVGNFRQTEHEHFDLLRDRLEECSGALCQSAEHQRVVHSAVGELMEKSDTCLSFIDECSNVTKDIHSVAIETKSGVKTLDRYLQGASDTLIKKVHKVQNAVHQGTY